MGVSFALLASLVASEPLRILVLDLRFESVPESTARIVRDEIAVDMAQDTRLDVLSSEDLRQATSLEGDRQAAGCDEQACLADLGTALGARYIVHGSVALLGARTVIHLNLFDTAAARSVARETVEASNDDQLLPQLRAGLARVRARMLGSEAPPMATADAQPLQVTGAVISGAGALVAVVGGALMLLAAPDFYASTPRPGGPSPDQRLAAQSQGQVGTVVLVGGAAVAAVGGVILGVGSVP